MYSLYASYFVLRYDIHVINGRLTCLYFVCSISVDQMQVSPLRPLPYYDPPSSHISKLRNNCHVPFCWPRLKTITRRRCLLADINVARLLGNPSKVAAINRPGDISGHETVRKTPACCKFCLAYSSDYQTHKS